MHGLSTGATTPAALLAFVTAAFADPDFRTDLRVRPRKALLRFGYEAEGATSLSPPETPLSIGVDENSLLGPPDWRRGDADESAGIVERVESRLLLAGAKPLALMHGAERELAATGSWLRARGFAALLSPFQFTPVPDAGRGDYSNLASGLAPAVPGSGAWRGLLASADPRIAELGWLCLLFGWDQLLGRLLGYPTCCAQAFARDWPRAQRDFAGDPALMRIAEDGSGAIAAVPWEANVYARYFGIELIQHFPCRPDCAETRQLAHRHIQALCCWPSAAADLQEQLKAPILIGAEEWSGLFPGARLTRTAAGARLTFDPARARILAEGPLAATLKRDGEAVLESGLWHMGGRAWPARLLLFDGVPASIEEGCDALF